MGSVFVARPEHKVRHWASVETGLKLGSGNTQLWPMGVSVCEPLTHGCVGVRAPDLRVCRCATPDLWVCRCATPDLRVCRCATPDLRVCRCASPWPMSVSVCESLTYGCVGVRAPDLWVCRCASPWATLPLCRIMADSRSNAAVRF